jgi:putative ABC transport system substrate-binding protein
MVKFLSPRFLALSPFQQRLRLGLICLALLLQVVLPAGAALAKQTFVAVVIVSDLARYRTAHDAFLERLKAKGITEDQLRIYVQAPNADTQSLTNAVRKAVGVGADLLITYGAQATMVARKEAAKKLPLFFGDVSDPVGLDIVRDVGVAEKNIAGVSSKTPLETLIRAYRDIHPATRLGILFTPDEPGSSLQKLQLESLCLQQGLTAVALPVRKTDDIGPQLRAFFNAGGVLFVGDSPLLQKAAGEVLAQAQGAGVAVVSQIPGLAERGALVTIEADPVEQGELLAEQVLRVLQGGKAEDVPLSRPRNVALVINLQAAQRLKLTVPFQALKLATRVIK